MTVTTKFDATAVLTDTAGYNSCYAIACLNSCYSKAGCNSYYNEATHIGTLKNLPSVRPSLGRIGVSTLSVLNFGPWANIWPYFDFEYKS